MQKNKNIANVSKECVACGNCVKYCPKGAISVYKGIIAIVNSESCVGCGKCVKTCPASVICLISREAV